MHFMGAPSKALDDALIEVWRQGLLDHSNTVKIAGESFLFAKPPASALSKAISLSEGSPTAASSRIPSDRPRYARSMKEVQERSKVVTALTAFSA
jgi:hypothetical protein